MYKVVIADDDASIRSIYRACLDEHPDIEVTEVGDGEELVRELLTGVYDLGITDGSMPKKTGLEACIEAENIAGERGIKLPPVVMISGEINRYRQGPRPEIIANYFEKPADLDVLDSVVRRYLPPRGYVREV